MSYNISSWKTKRLDGLAIPLKAFFEHERTDFHPQKPTIINAETMEISMECGCEQEIEGILKDGIIHVTRMKMSGEGSGIFKHEVLDNALKQSAGELEAVLIWEGGDTISNFHVKNGIIEETDIEL